MLTDRPLSWDKALSPLPWDLPAIEDDLADKPSSSQPSTEDLSKLSVETLGGRQIHRGLRLRHGRGESSAAGGDHY